MKILENFIRQPRPYADSEGWLKIELEEGDNRKDIIKQYTKVKTAWYEEECRLIESMSTETLLVFRRHQMYLD